MIGFGQANDLLGMFPANFKDRQMTDWSDPTPATNGFCDEIDEIMKHEQGDVILIDDPLYAAPLDFDLDSMSDLLENQSSSAASSFTPSLNINDLASIPVTYSNNNNTSQSSVTTATSGYSSSDISPKFIRLSIDSNRLQQFIQSNNLNLSTFIQQQQQQQQSQQQQQQENAVLGRSYPFETQNNINESLDIKRFRSASMNEGAILQQQTKLDPHLFDSYRLESPNFINPPAYQDKPATTSDVSSTTLWPLVNCTRPVSGSFSEVDNQDEQVRSHRSASISYTGSSNLNLRNQGRFSNEPNIQSQTLYSINQSTKEASAASSRKRLSLVDFPVPEIKTDPTSPTGTVEQHSEADLWSDVEQNSSDHIQDDDITSDEEANIPTGTRKSSETHSSSSSLFWQYNVQSKGPKTKRILYLKERDPHLRREFSDPVYQIKLTQTKGQTFNKLRKGDGNDVTPNPMKLYQLGKQIRDLSNNTSSVYHGIYHIDHHISSSNETTEVKKQKNKIASRACRLRKKAQHEANKLKLHGLSEEHKSLNNIIISIKLAILARYRDGQLSSPSLSPNQSVEAVLDQLITKKYNQPVAGNTDGFVQTILNDIEHLQTVKQKRSYSLKT